ncbi:hypothetical protein OG746_27620 [Streptomyces sp. NBC_01016]|uniref:hypothetical protein n=1 Tax=unclassified Streptomyces TaxID=2593676 RepID=UPI002254A809|nr:MULTISPECIES: hypothetical protein [unclassified Streptomyces]MCX4832512.1 hypothetical protein [Streptomyces sp. NBC_01016]
MRSIASKRRVDLYVAAAPTIQFSYLLFTTPLSVSYPLLTLELLRLDTSKETL